jgi:ribosome-associated protein
VLRISASVSIPEAEIDWHAIRAQGSGGQNVNKVSSAVHLRFDIRASSLPEHYKTRLLALSDQRITADGVIVIKAQQHRSQEKNLLDARERLAELVRAAGVTQKKRRPTKPSRASQTRRMDSKTKHARNKKLRGKIDY